MVPASMLASLTKDLNKEIRGTVHHLEERKERRRERKRGDEETAGEERLNICWQIYMYSTCARMHTRTHPHNVHTHTFGWSVKPSALATKPTTWNERTERNERCARSRRGRYVVSMLAFYPRTFTTRTTLSKDPMAFLIWAKPLITHCLAASCLGINDIEYKFCGKRQLTLVPRRHLCPIYPCESWKKHRSDATHKFTSALTILHLWRRLVHSKTINCLWLQQGHRRIEGWWEQATRCPIPSNCFQQSEQPWVWEWCKKNKMKARSWKSPFAPFAALPPPSSLPRTFFPTTHLWHLQ